MVIVYLSFIFSPPWTFDVSADDAFTILKKIVSADPSFEIMEVEESQGYLKLDVQRTTTIDTMEFLVNGDDKVVLFKSAEKGGGSIVPDFGANKKRVEALRKSSDGIFTVMGSGLGTADSYDGGASGKGNGFKGQLKVCGD